MNGLVVKKVEEISKSFELEGVKVGRITSIDKDGNIFVDFPGNTNAAVRARFTNSIKHRLEKQTSLSALDVLLVFEDNDPEWPIIIDVIYSSIDRTRSEQQLDLNMGPPVDVRLDGKSLTFDAHEKIVLQCGKASITLTRAGKVMIKGAYLLNRSAGVNRIKGASVQIN
jgi:hypothetical protein